ncbi:MAG: hypothetical protein ACE5FJ_10675 [Gemmatimonadales bacterium]
MKATNTLIAIMTAIVPHAVSAQQEFDRARAWITDSTVFQPFMVTESTGLREALRERTVDAETHLMVFELGRERLALVTEQLAYHHVAQGELAGEPWLVSF